MSSDKCKFLFPTQECNLLGYRAYANSALVQFSSVAQLCPTLCDPMNRSTPGLPVHHQLLCLGQLGVLQYMPQAGLMSSYFFLTVVRLEVPDQVASMTRFF